MLTFSLTSVIGTASGIVGGLCLHSSFPYKSECNILRWHYSFYLCFSSIVCRTKVYPLLTFSSSCRLRKLNCQTCQRAPALAAPNIGGSILLLSHATSSIFSKVLWPLATMKTKHYSARNQCPPLSTIYLITIKLDLIDNRNHNLDLLLVQISEVRAYHSSFVLLLLLVSISLRPLLAVSY